MAIGLRRKVRLDSRRANQKKTRDANGGAKRAERVRREARVLAVVKTTNTAAELPDWAQSWVAQALHKEIRQISPADLKSLVQ